MPLSFMDIIPSGSNRGEAVTIFCRLCNEDAGMASTVEDLDVIVRTHLELRHEGVNRQ